MSSVDNRIVNMQFNNKQFTQGVNQTERDIAGLDKTLAKAGKASGLDKMGSAATQVSTKFSAMQIAGVTAVATIANKVTLAAGSMLKKLTIQPLIDGFREYTTNLESVQTIMANTGKSVKVVNGYLDQMNEYADQTIYNFSQMAKNVGTFTAAGVELPKAVSAIKGISNLAALSGSNSQQASTAMYQLSQAIAAGKVGLQDWNSVVNAGMGGKVFKNALAQTAVAMGDLSDNAVKVGTDVEIMGQSFRNSIMATPGSESWLTSDVLVTTLATLDGRFSKTAITAGLLADGYTELQAKEMTEAKMAKARIELAKQGVEFSEKEYNAMVKKADAAYQAATQIKTATQLFQVVQESIGSMWASAFRIILGDFKQSKELWGNVGDVVLGIVDNISGGFLGMLRVWEERGGRMKVIDGLANIFGGLVDIFGAIAKGFDAAFPDSKVSLLNRLSKVFFAFSEALVPSKETLADISTIAEGFFSIFHLGFTIIKGVAKGLGAFFGALFGATEGARGGILDMVAAVAEVVIAVEDWLTSGSKITRFLQGIGTLAGTALSPIVAGIGLIVDAFGALLSGEGIGGARAAFSEAGDVLGGFFGGILEGLDKITAPFDALKEDIADLAVTLVAPFEGLLDVLDRVRLQIVEGLGLDQVMPDLSGLRTLLQQAQDGFVNFAEGLRLPSVSMTDLGNAADWVVDKFQAMGEAVSDAVGKLDISGKLSAAKDGIKGLFDGLGGGASSGATSAAAGGAAAMTATADGATGAFEKLGDVVVGVWDIFKSVGGAIRSAFDGIINAISNIPFPDDAIEWATVLNALISGALIKKLFFSKGVFQELKDSIAAIGDAGSNALDQLTGTLKTMQGAIKSEMIKNIAIAVALLVASLVVLSFVPQEKLAQGLGALAAVMLMTGAMMQVMMSSLKKMKADELIKYGAGFALMGVGMIAMATAILILTAAVGVLAVIPFDKLKQGLGALAIVMGLLVVSLLLLSGQSAKVLAVGGAMFLMAAAINMLVPAIVILGSLPFDTLKQGLGGLAIGIGIMVVALLLLSSVGAKVLAAGGAMIMLAMALEILIPAIVTLGLLPWDVVEQGLLAVGIGIGIMTVALLLLAGGGPAILAAGAAMLMIAAAMNILIPLIVTLGALPWSVVEQGLIAMGLALGILVLAGYLAIGAAPGLAALSWIILALGAAMLMAGTGMFLFGAGLALIAATGAAAIAVLTLAIGAFIALLPNIAIQMAAAFVTFLQALAAASPKIREAFNKIFREILKAIDEASKDIDKLFDNLIDMAIENFEDHTPDFFLAGWNVIDEIISGLEEKIPDLVERATTMALDFLEELGDNAVRFAEGGKQILIDTMEGLEDAIESSNEVRDAARSLANTFVNEVQETISEGFASLVIPSIPKPGLKLLGMVAGKDGDERRGYNPGRPGSLEDDYNSMQRAGNTLAQKVAKALTEAGAQVANAISDALTMFTGGNTTGKAAQYMRQADTAQTAAAYSTQAAEILDSRATAAEEKAERQRQKAEKIKDKKKRQAELRRINKKGAGADASRLRGRANKEARAAEKAQALADERAQAARDELSFDSAIKSKDFEGAAGIRSQQGQDLADKAQSMLASAQAKEDQAAKLAKGNKKDRERAEELRKQARREAAEANRLAQDSVTILAEANQLYADARAEAAKAVRARMADIRTMMAERDAERAWQKEFDAADGDVAKQADMLNKRAEANEAKAATARTAMETALTEAERLADTDAVAAQLQLDEAERQAGIANAAADSAEADRKQAESMLEQAKDAADAGTTTSGAQITPSRTAMEDAANAVDRYTASVQQAEDQASSGPSSVTFNQNNYSPEALPASTIYRHGKNLVSAAEFKMAGH